MDENVRVAIRKADPADVSILAWMNDRLVTDQGSASSWSLERFQRRFEEWLRTGEWQVDVFEEDEQVVGYAVYQERDHYYEDETVTYLRQFYIDRDHRGEGIGREALSVLLETRFPKGRPVTVDVVATNPGGREFWKKMGFSPYFTQMTRPGNDQQ